MNNNIKMKCIFCKKDSSNTKSIEHIVPESLCNDHHILPKGMVCDSCNNYFSRKIEAPVLNSDEFKYLRYHQGIVSKKKKIPKINAFLNFKPFELSYALDDPMGLIIENPDILKELEQLRGGELIIPFSGKSSSDLQMGRFLAKMAVEYSALKMYETLEYKDFNVFIEHLEAIIIFVRNPPKGFIWEYSKRKIYEQNDIYKDGDNYYQTVVEFDMILEQKEYIDEDNILCDVYFIIAIFGMEYAISLTSPYIDNYKKYLECNNYISPLYLKNMSTDTKKNRNLLKTKI